MTNRILIAFITTAFAAAFAGLGTGTSGCASDPNIHLTAEAQGQPCTKCHISAYAAAVDPPHENVLPQTCGDCHDQLAWSPIKDLHTLDGVKQVTCVKCHQKDYDGTTNPVHKGEFPTDCKDCHGTDKYQPLRRDIHTTQTFASTNGVCYGCHVENYKSAPGHVEGNYPHTCGDCHNVGTAWLPTKS